MQRGIAEIYGRVLPFARAMPLAVAVPFAAELAQHAAEISLGMYASGAEMTPEDERVRLGFGAVKVLALFLVLIFALRYWAWDGDARRAARPNPALFKGLAILLLVQIGGELLVLAAASLGGKAVGLDSAQQQAAVSVAAIFLWLALATYLLPWFTALLVEDRAMTLPRSIAAIRGHLLPSFGLLLAGYLPLMALHYALGYGAMGQAEPLVWVLMVVDSAVVALLGVTLASTYFTIYRRAG